MTEFSNKQIITGNTLLSGEAVFLSGDDTFGPDLFNAQIFTDDVSANHALSQCIERSDEIISPYLVSVDVQNSVIRPQELREQIRTAGPSNYFHGKQTEIR